MDIKSILTDLEYLSDVTPRHKMYHVFRGPKHYVVTSLKSVADGFFTAVNRDAVDFLAKRFAGKTVTNPQLSKTKLVARRFHGDFQILNTLYVLVAEGRAKINRKLTGKNSGPIFFDIKRPTPLDQCKTVARWMNDQVSGGEEFYQTDASKKIAKLFGSEFVYRDPAGNLAIDGRVLNQFRRITKETVVWVTHVRGGFWPEAHWREREPHDLPGRTQPMLV